MDSLSYIAPHGGAGAVAAARPISVPTAPVPVPELPVDLWSDHHRPPTPQAPAGPTGPSRSSARRSRWVIEWVTVLLIAIVLAVGVRTYVAQMFYIPSGSMLPTLQVGDRIVVDKLSYHLHGVGRGDVVVFRRPPLEQAAYADLVKRVIGLPGDTIGAVDGRVTVDGRALAEPWLPVPRPQTIPSPLSAPYSLNHPFVVPAGEYFVMGDNRTDSADSRYFGPIPGDLIVGRMVIKVWPLSGSVWLAAVVAVVAVALVVALVALRRGRHPGLHTTGQGRGPPTTRAVG